MLRVVIASCVALVVALAGCGGDSDGGSKGTEAREATTPTATTPAKTARCEKVPAALRRALEASLKSGRLGKIAAVKSDDSFKSAPGLAAGVYFVSADVRPNPGVSTWAVSRDAFRTGIGFIVGVDAAARAVAVFGVGVDVSKFGISEASDGYDESRDCLA